jgi:hypothetical protein
MLESSEINYFLQVLYFKVSLFSTLFCTCDMAQSRFGLGVRSDRTEPIGSLVFYEICYLKMRIVDQFLGIMKTEQNSVSVSLVRSRS